MTDKLNNPNLTQLLELVKKMQKTQDHLQQELAKLRVTGNASGGLVKVNMNGHYETTVEIKQEALQEGKTILEDLLTAATHDAVQQVDSAIESKTLALSQELPKELGLPTDLSTATSNANLNEEAKKMAQNMQQNMLQTREQLAKMEVTGYAGGDLVSVTMNGRHHIKLVIKEETLQEASQAGKTILEELVAAAINDANRRLREISQNKAYDIVKDLGPLFNKLPKE
ncbi:MAG: YbaB/EbfC family nucleoid-associated protein [Gammaproteobacteria bacterium]